MKGNYEDLVDAQELRDYWRSKCGQYQSTNLGVDQTKHGGPGGTYKEINERRAARNFEFYVQLCEDINLEKEIERWRMDKLRKDTARFVK